MPSITSSPSTPTFRRPSTGTDVSLQDQDQNKLSSSNTGWGFQVMAGKEWWVGTEWALGVAGEITGAWMKGHEDPNLRWSSFAYTLAFSATYN